MSVLFVIYYNTYLLVLYITMTTSCDILPQIKQNSDYIYFNTGDWIEACTAITEDREESFELKGFSKNKSVLINKL